MNFNWSYEKDKFLKRDRNISFEDVIESIRNGGLIGIEPHYNKQLYGHQSVILCLLFMMMKKMRHFSKQLFQAGNIQRKS